MRMRWEKNLGVIHSHRENKLWYLSMGRSAYDNSDYILVRSEEEYFYNRDRKSAIQMSRLVSDFNNFFVMEKYETV